MKNLNTVENYREIIQKDIPILDVRAEIEFSEGSFPGAENHPILDNNERHCVGACYKLSGQEAAVTLGHTIVQGENKERKLRHWMQFFKNNPQGYLTCFRGGLRSQIAQQWLLENKFDVPRLKEGYKGFRFWAIDQLQQETKNRTVKVISGTTGSGKTLFLEQYSGPLRVIDLEHHANHRGSAFGNKGVQPSQADFEHQVLRAFLKTPATQDILIEDESRLIGQRALPPAVFNLIRASSILLIEEPLHSRAEHIFEYYILRQSEKPEIVLAKYIQSTQAIAKKLGSERTREVISDIQACQIVSNNDSNEFKSANLKWIEKLLVWYYDPMYLGSLEKRNPKIDFRGTREQLRDYLQC